MLEARGASLLGRCSARTEERAIHDEMSAPMPGIDASDLARWLKEQAGDLFWSSTASPGWRRTFSRRCTGATWPKY
jgi:hypothetical protein